MLFDCWVDKYESSNSEKFVSRTSSSHYSNRTLLSILLQSHLPIYALLVLLVSGLITPLLHHEHTSRLGDLRLEERLEGRKVGALRNGLQPFFCWPTRFSLQAP